MEPTGRPSPNHTPSCKRDQWQHHGIPLASLHLLL